MPLAAVKDGDKFALIGSNFGQKNNPGWYYNLKANPKCTVRVDGQSGEYIARETQGEEREKYWQMAVGFYAGYELYEKRASHRRIPVIILEPSK
jgi:deazaflavin-dependent oxidoreductase (nitroreductase family)